MIEVTGDSARGADWAFVRLRIEGDRIVEADADGLVADLTGLTLLEAAAVGGETLPVDALANALGPVLGSTASPTRTAVAMSGGVDSAVALLRAGPNAVGVTLRLWIDPDGPDATRACCSPDAVLAARDTCHSLGLSHVTLDLRREFKQRIVEDFVRGYARGQTPNPCIRCNGDFRFDELIAFAERAGAARLATGHYARIVEHRGRRLLARAADARKDQSYMLARLDPRLLDRVWFPLGEQTKEETRTEAERAGLAAARRAESQEACFLAGADYRDFLARAGLPQEEGAVVDESGAELGRHEGFWRFTPGQRRGLGLAAGSPLHVLRTDAATNTVVAGPREALVCSTVEVAGSLYVPVERVEAKVRYRSPAVPARVRPTGEGFELELEEPTEAVAPGQAAVLYERETVVGAGTITAASQ